MSIRHMKNLFLCSHYFFLCTEQFTYTNLFTFSQDRAAHFFFGKMYIHYYNIIIIIIIIIILCAHILYFDAAKFSIKLFSLMYLIGFCCQTAV